MRIAHRYLTVALGVAVSLSFPAQGPAADFTAGSLIIPMDTTYQDTGMLKAFGLVYQLLASGIPIDQVVQPGKAQGGVDMTASATDVQTAAVITNHGYRGGPFVIEAAHRGIALPIVAAWHDSGNVTTVHEATLPFAAPVATTLFDRPAIAVFADGNELVAFDNLNAAGIPDGQGQAWPTSTDVSRAYTGYPDVLNAAEVAGPTVTGAADGALFRGDGTPAYCHFISMHHSIPLDDEVVREVRQWLDWGPGPHLFLQCLSITVFENAASGLFLTTGGLRDDGGIPAPLRFWRPDVPSAQFDGPLTGDGGSVNSIGLVLGSSFRPNIAVLIEEDDGQATELQVQMLYLTGYLDGNPAKGRVTCLGGHNYSTALPVTSNPQTNGVRLFLNSLFDDSCDLGPTVSVGGPTTLAAEAALRIWSAPEPFTGTTRIRYLVPMPGPVDVSVFDVRGARVRQLFSGRAAAGLHEVDWDGRRSSGQRMGSDVYWVRVMTSGGSSARRISLVR